MQSQVVNLVPRPRVQFKKKYMQCMFERLGARLTSGVSATICCRGLPGPLLLAPPRALAGRGSLVVQLHPAPLPQATAYRPVATLDQKHLLGLQRRARVRLRLGVGSG